MSSCVEKLSYSEKPLRFTPHKHNVYQLIYITEGQADFVISGKEYRVSAPSVIFISNLEEHSFTIKSMQYKRYALYINPEKAKSSIKDLRLISLFSNRPQSFEHCIRVDKIKDSLDAIFRLLLNEYNSKITDNNISNMLIKSFLIIMMRNFPDSFSDTNSTAQSIVSSVKYTLEKNLSRNFPLDELSAQHNISVYYLAHAFKQTTGYSIKQYHILCRVSAAKEMLSFSQMSVSEICYSVGFNDLSNFSRIFSRITGLSPSEYRAKTNQTEEA